VVRAVTLYQLSPHQGELFHGGIGASLNRSGTRALSEWPKTQELRDFGLPSGVTEELLGTPCGKASVQRQNRLLQNKIPAGSAEGFWNEIYDSNLRHRHREHLFPARPNGPRDRRHQQDVANFEERYQKFSIIHMLAVSFQS
jgi:hypothetical protein